MIVVNYDKLREKNYQCSLVDDLRLKLRPIEKIEWRAIAGIYVFMNKRSVPIYIGQSTNIIQRIGQHFSNVSIFDDCDVWFVEVEDDDLNPCEHALIDYYKPIVNMTGYYQYAGERNAVLAESMKHYNANNKPTIDELRKAVEGLNRHGAKLDMKTETPIRKSRILEKIALSDHIHNGKQFKRSRGEDGRCHFAVIG